MEGEPFKSQRAIDEEVRQYKFKRFEDYMQQADRGELPRALAITAFAEEVAVVFEPQEDADVAG